MATLDELEARVNNLERDVNSLERTVNNNTQNIANHTQNIANINIRLNNHDTEIATLKERITNLNNKHESDYKYITDYLDYLNAWKEYLLKYDQYIEDVYTQWLSGRMMYIYTRQVRFPDKGNQKDSGLKLYMPMDLTLDDYMAYNEPISNDIKFHWFTKIFNKNGTGKVSFDLDNKFNTIKTITIGPGARVMIPSGLKFVTKNSKTSWLSVDHKSNCNYKGIIATVSIIEHQEDFIPGELNEYIITLYNPTCHVIDIPAGSVLMELCPVIKSNIDLTYGVDGKDEQATKEFFDTVGDNHDSKIPEPDKPIVEFPSHNHNTHQPV